MKIADRQKEVKKRDKILFKHYTYRGGADYVDIVSAMEEYAEYKCALLKSRLEREKSLANEGKPQN